MRQLMGIKFNPKTNLWDASFSKRPKGGGNPKTLKRRGMKSKAEASRVYNELVIQVDQKVNRKKSVTFSKLLIAYILSNKDVNWSLKTTENYESTLKAYADPLWGDISVSEITPPDIRKFFEPFRERPESYRKSLYKYIRGIFQFAVEQGIIPSNPVPKMKFRIGFKIENILNESQVLQFLKQAKEMNWPWYPHCLMALSTGMRNGELFALDWDHVSLDEKRIVVARTWNNKDGFKEYPKNGDHRIVEISNSLLEKLKILKEENPESAFVLPRLDRWERGEQARDLRMFLSGLGLPTIRFHDLRATWATILMTKGTAPIKVMVMGGWKDIKTMGRYIRKAGVEIKGITDVLPY